MLYQIIHRMTFENIALELISAVSESTKSKDEKLQI